MINLFNTNIKVKHVFIMLNKDKGKWLNRTLTCITINSGMGIQNQQQTDISIEQRFYLKAKAKAYKA